MATEAELRHTLAELGRWDIGRLYNQAEWQLLTAAITELVALREEVGRLREEARELERATPQGRVLAVLEGAHVPLTLSCILRGAHTHRARTLKFLHELVAEGAVVREGAGKRSQPFFYALSTWYTSQRERWGDD